MIEIIPNSHPIFVKFVVTLIVLTGLLQLALWFIPAAKKQPGLVHGFPWLVGVGVLAVLAALISGFIAYYTVPHDGPSHVVMTNHKYWAILLSLVYLAGAALFFSAERLRADLRPRAATFSGAAFIAALLLVTITASQGAQLVFKHGIGVQSLPEVTGEGHDHHH